jgi:D-threo-aldose 1-dehydrogenase
MTAALVGFGGAPIGGLYAAVTEETARETLQTAWDCDIRYYDTAPLYGYGLSEQRIGAFLADKPRAQYTLSTKVGRVLVPATGGEDRSGSLGRFSGALAYDAVFDFSSDAVRRSLESSLERLGGSYVDIAYIHDPDDHLEQAIRETFPALLRLRDEGLVKSIGVGTNRCDPAERFVRECDLDVVMIAGRYTLLDRTAEETLLPVCAQRGVRVAVAGVFNSGILSARTPDAGTRYDYAPADATTLQRSQYIAEVCRRYGIGLPEAAIAFASRHPAVWAVVLGMRTPEEVRDDVRYSRARIPDALWRDLQ